LHAVQIAADVILETGLTRRQFFLSVPALGLTLPTYGHFVEPHWFERTSHRVRLPGLSPGARIRVLQLSDLHVSPFVPFSVIEQAIDIGLAARPDVICLTGDFITDAAAFDERRYTESLARLASSAPTFACLGNHDGGSWTLSIGGFSDSSVIRRVLASSGVMLLHNESRTMSVRGNTLQLAGLGDIWNREADPDAAFANTDANLPTLLLAHNPDAKDIAAGYPWQVMLAGHTHGGQILVPVVGTRFVAIKDKRFVAGLRKWRGRQVYVTRGVGSLGGIRFNCRPEVTLLELTGEPRLNQLI
jgi:predicted MPP superfamily phosphohydrolase